MSTLGMYIRTNTSSLSVIDIGDVQWCAIFVGGGDGCVVSKRLIAVSSILGALPVVVATEGVQGCFCCYMHVVQSYGCMGIEQTDSTAAGSPTW
jgi:hypothetical protein